jgi:hypothetical protein
VFDAAGGAVAAPMFLSSDATISSAGELATAGGAVVLMAEGEATGLGTSVAIAAITGDTVDLVAATAVRAAVNSLVEDNVPAAEKYSSMRGCYGGNNGTWLELHGGPQEYNGALVHNKLELKVSTLDDVFNNGTLTNESKADFDTLEDKSSFPQCSGHKRCKGCDMAKFFNA